MIQTTSPQEEYDYDQLWKYLNVARTALSNYHEKYPSLAITHDSPERHVMNITGKVSGTYSDNWFERTQYLDPEDYGIAIGAVAHYTKKKELGRLERRLSELNDRFEKNLLTLIQQHEIEVKGLLMRQSHITAKHTAGRIQEQNRRMRWVDTQYYYYANFHVRQIEAFGVVQEYNWVFTNSSEPLPEFSGVYVFFHAGEPVYVGRTSNLAQRISNHDVVRKYHCKNEHDQIECVYAIIDQNDIDEIERALIRMLSPKYNQRGKDQ